MGRVATYGRTTAQKGESEREFVTRRARESVPVSGRKLAADVVPCSRVFLLLGEIMGHAGRFTDPLSGAQLWRSVDAVTGSRGGTLHDSLD